MDFGEAIRRATEAELSGPEAKRHLAESRKSLAALERIRSSESLREVCILEHLTEKKVPYTTKHLAAGLVPVTLYTTR